MSIRSSMAHLLVIRMHDCLEIRSGELIINLVALCQTLSDLPSGSVEFKGTGCIETSTEETYMFYLRFAATKIGRSL
jgi:hypothetical protein